VQPFYLRSNVLDTFTGSGWRVNPNGHGNTERLALSPSLDVTPTVSAPRTVSYQADITVTGLTGNAPIFAMPRAVEGLDATTDWTPTDLLLINSSVHRGQEYVENVAQPDPTQDQLNAEPAVDLPDMQRWLELPSGVPAYVTNLVHRITAGRTTPYERARAISDWFANPANGFVYSLHTKQGDSGNDLVDFLHNRSGFCQQYAAAMGVMLRVADVPSRLVLGYMHNPPDASGNFTITTFDAHAWVEAFFPGVGWTPFDPTPADGLVGGQRTDLAWAPHVYASASAAAPSVSKNLNTPQPSGSGSTPAQQTSGAAHNSFPLGPVVWTVVAVLGLMLIGLTPALVRGIRRRRRYAAARRGDPDPLWEELSDTAVDLGYVWSPARTPRQVSTWLSRDAADTAPALHALAIAVEQRRYAPDAAPPDAAALARGLQDVTDQLRSVRRGRVRLSSRIWPASLGWGRQLRWMRTAVRRRPRAGGAVGIGLALVLVEPAAQPLLHPALEAAARPGRAGGCGTRRGAAEPAAAAQHLHGVPAGRDDEDEADDAQDDDVGDQPDEDECQPRGDAKPAQQCRAARS
jgi:transglutaminase-like putative cysteine protease